MSAIPAPGAGQHAGLPVPCEVELVPGPDGAAALILCDHASNAMPPEFGDLGLPAAQLQRHIAYDIGAAWVTRRLAARLDCPAILSTFSRLLIDPNRGLDDPTLVMRLSDGAIVPGNARLDEAGIAARVARFYQPYDKAVGDAVSQRIALGRPPAIVSVHSFTPLWKGRPRPWHVGVLWDRDDRIVAPLFRALRAEADLVIGDNEPYAGWLSGDTIHRHATRHGLPSALIELRQDLIDTEAKASAWADRLAAMLAPILDDWRLTGAALLPQAARA
ncbi:MAG: N-formylglutamate amidohydrolase [Bosea sp.]|nr:N-formylglutamate amidohydrolase [Bosea sp. (in: a-proteobacteria)]